MLRQAAQARRHALQPLCLTAGQGKLPLTGAIMQRGLAAAGHQPPSSSRGPQAAAGDQLPSSSRGPQAAAAACTAEAGRSRRLRKQPGHLRGLPASAMSRLPGSQGNGQSQHSPGMSDAAYSGSSKEASKDEASSSERSSGAADEKSLDERRAVDRANHAADQRHVRYFVKLMQAVAGAHKCDVSVAVTAFSNSRPNSNIREAVAGLAGTQKSLVMPHLAKIRKIMAGTVEACVRGLAQEAQSQLYSRRRSSKRATRRAPHADPWGMVRVSQQSSLQQPKTRLAMLSCCARHRLLALLTGLRWLPATQRDLCSKVSHIILHQLHRTHC